MLRDKQKKLEFVITAETTKFKKGISDSLRQLNGMERGIKSIGGSIKSSFAGIGRNLAIGVAAGVAAATLSLSKLQSSMRGYIALANVQEKAEIRLAGVLRATGEAAGISFQEMKKFAGELQNVTAVGDEVSLAAMGILATFKQIKGDQFREATKAAIDMSVVLDTDLKSSIMQIGKALNDPVRGVSALSDAGVQFTDSQREMIKQMIKTNNVVGAQKIILAELNGQFGGTAEAMRSTFGASIDSVMGRLNDLKEKMGESFTKNKFFLEGSKLLEGVFISWGAEIDANSEAWRRWSKGASLAVMEFVADTGDGLNTTYKTFQKINGVLELSFAGAAKLGKAWQFLFEAVNRLTGNNEKADQWAQAQQYNAEAIEGAYQRAAEAFDNADMGLPMMEKATERVRKLKEELAKIEPALVDVAANVTGAAEKDTIKLDDSIALIEGTWTNVYTTAKKEQSEFFKQAMRDLERLQKEAANIKYGTGTTTTQGFARGGAIKPFFGGLRGYGGGDRRLVLVEDGEHVIRKEAVARLGHGFFQKFNRLQFPSLPKFAQGGPIGSQFSGAMGGGPEVTVKFDFPGATTTPRGRFSQQDASEMMRIMEGMHKRRS